MKTVVVLLAFLICAPAVVGQNDSQPKVRIYVDYTGVDTVGARFVRFLEEDINKSSRYELAAAADHRPLGAGDNAFTLEIVTMDGDPQRPGFFSAASSLLAYQETRCDYILKHNLLVIGSYPTEEQADSLLAEIDKDFEKLRTLATSRIK